MDTFLAAPPAAPRSRVSAIVSGCVHLLVLIAVGVVPLYLYATKVMQINRDTLQRIKSDYRETLAKLHLDYLHTWVEWSHARGFLVRNQSHGAPGNLLDLYANADIAETEIFGAGEVDTDAG